MIYIYASAILLCIIFSAFFSASEMAYSAANRVRFEHMAENGSGRAQRALAVLNRFDDALSAILVGNNLVNIAASSLGSVAVILLFGEKYAWLSTLIITVLVIIFGETIPKIAAKKNANRLSLAFSAPVRFLMTVLTPVTWAVVGLTHLITNGMRGEEQDEDEAEEAAALELHSIIETAENEKVLDEDASELVSAAIDFPEKSASEIMTARVDVTAIDIDDDWEEILDTVLDSTFSRLPVYEDSIDNIIGMLPLNRLLKALIDIRRVDIRPMLMPPCYVYKTMKLPQVLEAMQNAQQHLAIVTDEYGGTLGVISMEDVLEELVGEIWDETDTVEAEVTETAAGEYVLDGDMPVSDFLEIIDVSEDAFDYDSETVGGWCIEMLEAFPAAGAAFSFENALVTVEEVDERRVRRVRVKIDPDKE